jgi:SSS family solute:Na+ symporter
MSLLDWLVLVATLTFIVAYGTWKTRGAKNIEGFLLGDKQMKWWTICLSIMGTQASAITFLSTPGQAFEDGMRFIQFYLGLPLAMVIISITFVPLYSRLKVFTAYEYLESRFDLKTRVLASLLFLVQRGFSTGITIYAPAIVLSTIMGWNLTFTNIIIGGLVIIYTVAGGTKAVSVTQEYQMAVIIAGMCVAGFMVIKLLPGQIRFTDAVNIAGHMGKMNVIDFSFNWQDRYNFWSGLLGGSFLALSYFGTDQSQVARYLSGRSVYESRLGLLFNGLLKIPMQFLILLLGVLVFVFYQFYLPPLFFNNSELRKLEHSPYKGQYLALKSEHEKNFLLKKEEVHHLLNAVRENDDVEIAQQEQKLQELSGKEKMLKKQVSGLVAKADPGAEPKDTDYVFISFIISYLPKGLVGLLLAVMFCAAMSSTSSGLNALASTTCVDIYKRCFVKKGEERHYLLWSRIFTIGWGMIAICFAVMASMLENLIQAVNILGSLFYGTILGIFLCAFYVRFIKSQAVFFAALVAEGIVILCYIYSDIGYLWYNVIGCFAVVFIATLLQMLKFGKVEGNKE